MCSPAQELELQTLLLWIPRTQTQILVLVWQAFDQLSYRLSPVSFSKAKYVSLLITLKYISLQGKSDNIDKDKIHLLQPLPPTPSPS